jgi:hypothetical protein
MVTLEDEKNDIRGRGPGPRIRRRSRRSARLRQHIAGWRSLRRGDVVAIFLLAAIVGIAVITVVKFPNFGWTNLGAGALRFGPAGTRLCAASITPLSGAGCGMVLLRASTSPTMFDGYILVNGKPGIGKALLKSVQLPSGKPNTG